MNQSRPAVDILEEAVNLLRSAPASILAAYLVGAIPFIVALLFFLNDMLHGAFASTHLLSGSLALAALYIWKNVWQAVFAGGLFRTLSPGPKGGIFRLILIVATLQPIGLIAPLPFPWLVAFFRNVSIFAAAGNPDPLRAASRQSVLWTRQNWAILLVVTLGGLVIFVNALAVIILLPQLGRMFLGIEGDLVRAGGHILNASTLAVALAIAWMAIDPLLDAVYVLRCFYGESLSTGEDLRAALRRAVAVVVLLIAIVPAHAQSIDPAKLDRSIDDVVHRREFTWRTPQAAGAEPQGRWVAWVVAAENAAHRVWAYIKRVIEQWLKQNPEKEQQGEGSPVTRRMLEALIALIVAIIAGAAVAFYMRRRAPAVAAKPVAAAMPLDLEDKSLTPDQLPESEWLALAEECLARGDLRLAIRALYLADLNFLGGRGLVSIRKWKSGLDYRRELKRRSPNGEIWSIFAHNTAQFDRVWYGFGQVERNAVEEFAGGLARMKASLR